MNDQYLKLELRFEDEPPQDALSSLKGVDARDVVQSKQHGFTGIELAIAGTVLVSSIGSLIAKLSRLWKCGIIIDTRNSKIRVEKNCDLPRGSVLVINSDGTETKLDKVSEQQLNIAIGKLGTANA